MDISDADQAMMAALLQYKLKQYVNLANQCVGALLMDREGAQTHLRDAVGMKMGHVHKFMDTIWQQASGEATLGVAASLSGAKPYVARGVDIDGR